MLFMQSCSPEVKVARTMSQEKKWKQIMSQKLEEKRQKIQENFPSISALVDSVTNLTISAPGEPDLNSNVPSHVENQPRIAPSSHTTEERKIVPDPNEFKLSAYEVTHESPTYKQYRRLNPLEFRKKRVAVIYSPEEEQAGEALILDSPTTSINSTSRNKMVNNDVEKMNEEPPARSRSPLPKFKNPFKGKSKRIRKCTSSPNINTMPPPKIVIQTPEYVPCVEESSIKRNETYTFDSILNLPSTSKQMFIPIDEIQKITDTIRKKVSPFSTQPNSPVKTPTKQSPLQKSPEVVKKPYKEFINRRRPNRKRQFRRQAKLLKKRATKFGSRLIQQGIDWYKK